MDSSKCSSVIVKEENINEIESNEEDSMGTNRSPTMNGGKKRKHKQSPAPISLESTCETDLYVKEEEILNYDIGNDDIAIQNALNAIHMVHNFPASYNSRKRHIEDDDEGHAKSIPNKKSLRKNKAEAFYDTAIDTLKALTKSFTKEDDDISIFTKHVESTLRSFPNSTRSLAKLNIQNILYKAEIKALIHPSLNSNNP